MPILTFLSEAQALHNPPAEYLHGHAVPFFESPQRAERIESALTAAGLIDKHVPVTMDAHIIAETHDPAMVDYLRDLSTNSQQIIRNDFAIYGMADTLKGDEYYYESIFPAQMIAPRISDQKSFIYDNTSPVGQGTWTAALSAASAAFAGADALLNGVNQAYALCRPPGHHAGRAAMGGYCYLNNAAIAANSLRNTGRVAIIDVDYHHGNGTQDIFWNDSQVLYVSLHADPAVDYPYYTGYTDENTPGNLNLPLPFGTTEQDYLAALATAFSAIQSFGPMYLVVSLGFDIYKGDPMGRFAIDVPFFEELGARLAGIGLPTLYVQEGGYNIDQLGNMAVNFFKGVERGRNAASTG